METILKPRPFSFWLRWTIISTLVIPLSYLISLVAVLLVHGAFGFNMNEWGTPLSQTLMQMAGGAVIGLGAGIYQKSLLEKSFDVKNSWIYTLIIGFVATELIAGIILWQMDLNRGELRFIEFNPLPEAAIFACIGFVTGILQCFLLRRSFTGSILWIIASTAGWGICFLVMAFAYLFPSLLHSTVALVLFFLLCSLLYGAITGAALLRILQKKKITS